MNPPKIAGKGTLLRPTVFMLKINSKLKNSGIQVTTAELVLNYLFSAFMLKWILVYYRQRGHFKYLKITSELMGPLNF